MSARPFRQSMRGLHTWSGLLLGWISFAIFLTGTATYYRWEITRWMQPELQRAGNPFDAARAAVTHLEQVAAHSPQWAVNLPDTRQAATLAFWRQPEGPRRFASAILDPRSGQPVLARDTLGGEFFYRFHFQLQLPYPWGRYLACLAALAMFVALISGIVTHRQFFADFFTFRAARGGHRAWLDLHNLTAVLGLPFYLMITYSALVIFYNLVMPWGTRALTPPASPPAEVAATASADPVAPDWVEPAPLAPLLDFAQRQWKDDPAVSIQRFDVSGRGTANCTVTFIRRSGRHVALTARDQLRFNGVTGALLDPPAADGGLGRTSHGVLYGLHLARFAGPILRALFFIMGLAGTALIATGLVLWTIKRRPRHRHGPLPFGHALVERLNLASLAGLPLACAAFFWANRLLPLDLPARGDREVQVFLWTWAAALVHACLRPSFTGWREQLRAGAVLYFLIPAIDLLTAREALLTHLSQGDFVQLTFDAAMLACGTVLWVAAQRLPRSTR